MTEEQTTEMQVENSDTNMSATVADASPKLITFSNLFMGSFKAVLKRPGLVASVFLAYIGITGAFVGVSFATVGGLMLSFFKGTLSTNGLIILAVLGIIIYTALIILYVAAGTAVLRAAIMRREQVGYWKSFVWSIKNIWPIFLIGLYIQLATITGYALLIIPGLVLAFYTSFSLFAFVSEGTIGLNALLRSINLVHGQFWAITWRTIAFSFSVMLCLVLPIVILMAVSIGAAPLAIVPVPFIIAIAYPFIIVWMVFGFTMLFESAQAIRPVYQFNPLEYTKIKNVLVAAAILGLPLLLAFNAYTIFGESAVEEAELTGDDLPAIFNLQ